MDLDSSVPDWLIEHPSLLPLFEQLQIEYCCGGKSLRTACCERGLDPCDVLRRCQELLAKALPPGNQEQNRQE